MNIRHKKPAYLDLFLQQVANFCLPSMLRDRATGQRQPFRKQRSEVASKSLQYLRLRPGFGGHPITQPPIFNLSSLVHFSPCHQGGEHHRLLHLLSGLSSSSVIDSNGRRTKRKKFRRNSGTALTPPPLINVTRAVVFQSSHSNFIAEYQQSGWSLSKHFWACAKLPSITDPSLIPKHLGKLLFVFRNVTPRLPRSISKEPVFCR